MQSLIPWRRNEERSVFDMFNQLQRDMNRVFDSFMSPTSRYEGSMMPGMHFNPKVDLAENPEGYEIVAELPGLTEKDIHCTLTGNLLTLRGEKKSEREDKKKDYHYVERSYGSFERTFNLGAEVEPGKVSARMKDGVLTIMVPKSMSAQKATKQITIHGG